MGKILAEASRKELANPELIGKIANHLAEQTAFVEYRAKRSTNTLRQQDATLRKFAEFITEKLSL